ncbi:MAG: hypothetical protein AAGJ83_02610 [Planctomycetota bacterium]
MIVLFIGIASAVLLRPAKVSLDPGGYEIAMALYRVCNQRSDVGLDQLEIKLREYELASGPNQEQASELRAIVSEARDGNWESALRSCRKLLEDQVER